MKCRGNTCPGIYLKMKLVISLHPLISSVFWNLASKWYAQGCMKSSTESLSPLLVHLCTVIHNTDPFFSRPISDSQWSSPRNKDAEQHHGVGDRLMADTLICSGLICLGCSCIWLWILPRILKKIKICSWSLTCIADRGSSHFSASTHRESESFSCWQCVSEEGAWRDNCWCSEGKSEVSPLLFHA